MSFGAAIFHRGPVDLSTNNDANPGVSLQHGSNAPSIYEAIAPGTIPLFAGKVSGDTQYRMQLTSTQLMVGTGALAPTGILLFNPAVVTAGITVVTVTAPAPTFASAAGTTYKVLNVATVTVTLTGGIGPVTAMNGVGLAVQAPTITSTSATTITKASTLFISGAPIVGGSVVYTNTYAADIEGAVLIVGAFTLTLPNNTANAFVIQDTAGPTQYFTIDTRTTVSGVTSLLTNATGPTIASAAGTTYSQFGNASETVTLTGGVLVTAMNGVTQIVNAPTLTSGVATTVTTASTVYIAGAPIAAGAGPVTITNAWALHVNGTVRIVGNLTLNANVTTTVAATWSMIAATASALIFNDGTTTLRAYDTRIAVTGLTTHSFAPPAALSFASAAGNTYSLAQLNAFTLTQTGVTTITALNGLALNVQAPTVTNTSAGLTITAVSTVSIAAPIAAGNATFTAGYALGLGAGIQFTAASNINMPTATASALVIATGPANTAAIITIDTRTATSGVTAALFGGFSVSVPSAAGATYSTVGITPTTTNLSGGSMVTFVSGLSLRLDAPNLSGATTVTTASSFTVAAPISGGGALTITNGVAAYIADSAVQTGTYTNQFGLYVANLTRATTANFALSFQNNVQLRAAVDMVGTANVASMLRVTDGTTALLAVDSRNTVTGVITVNHTAPAALSVASAAGNTYSLVGVAAYTITQTGTTTITALAGLSLTIGSPTVTNTSAGLAITTVSAVIINGPLPAGNATFTNSFALDIPTFATNGTTAAALRLAPPTGATNNTALLLSGTATTGIDYTQTNSALTSGQMMNLTLSGSSVVVTAANTGSIVSFVSTATGFSGATQSLMTIRASGANATASVVLQGLNISVVNTGTTNTNIGINVSASGGSTANTAINIAAGLVLLAAGTGIQAGSATPIFISVGPTATVTVGTSGTLVCPYDTAAGATDAKDGNINGGLAGNNADAKLYVRLATVWKGVAVAGFDFPNYGSIAPVLGMGRPYDSALDNYDETKCPVCFVRMKPGEGHALIGDSYKYTPSGEVSNLHNYGAHLSCLPEFRVIAGRLGDVESRLLGVVDRLAGRLGLSRAEALAV